MMLVQLYLSISGHDCNKLFILFPFTFLIEILGSFFVYTAIILFKSIKSKFRNHYFTILFIRDFFRSTRRYFYNYLQWEPVPLNYFLFIATLIILNGTCAARVIYFSFIFLSFSNLIMYRFLFYLAAGYWGFNFIFLISVGKVFIFLNLNYDNITQFLQF
jgi:hypothetical protein